MPRKGKGSKLKGRGASVRKGKGARGTARDTAVARFWSTRIAAAIEAKKDYAKLAAEVLSYFKAKHTGLYQNEKLKQTVGDLSGMAAISVPKVAQARNALGPHLYMANPQRELKPRGGDKVLLGLARVLEAYVNYTPNEGGLQRQSRKAIDDGILRGRGFLQPYWNDVQQIVSSRYVSSKDVLIDPDVDDLEDAEWIAIRHREPLWRLKQRADKKDLWRFKELSEGKGTGGVGNPGGFLSDEDPEVDETNRAPYTNTLIDYYVVYSKMGSGLRGDDFEDGFERFDDQNDYVRLEIRPDYDKPLFEGEWEIPLYLDDAWPLAPFDPIETLDELWPVSLMGQVLALQMGIDLLSTLQLSRCKMLAKLLMACKAGTDEEVLEQVRHGTEAELLPIKLNSGERLSDVFHVINMGGGIPELREERAYYEKELEAATGVTPALHGASNAGAQDRSATASQMKVDAANARVSDLRNRTEEWQSRVARYEALYARLDLDAEEIAPYVPADTINLFFVRLTFPSGEVVPVREPDLPDDELDARVEALAPLSIQKIDPRAATFFDTSEEAAEAAAGLMEAFLIHLEGQGDTDPSMRERVQRLVVELGIEITGDPETDMQTAAEWVAQVTVEDVWRETESYSASTLAREIGYTVAVGSMQKHDPAREQELVQEEIQQVMPPALQTGNIELANAIWERRNEAAGIPEEDRLPGFAPPPPDPAQQQPAPVGAPQ